MKNMLSKIGLLAITVMLAVGVSNAFAVDEVKSSHFEGGKNLSQPYQKKGEKTLAALMLQLQKDANALVKYSSAATAGGAATEAVVVTGLGATDAILAVTQKTKGANSLPLLSWSTQGANTLTLIYSADPGAGAIVDVLVKKP